MEPPAPEIAPVDRLRSSLVEDGQLLFLALHLDGTIAYASSALDPVLGRLPADVVGTSVLDWLHPDDLERAVDQIASTSTAGITRGITIFRVLHADGRWVPVEIWANPVSDGEHDFIGIYARDGAHQIFLEEVMAMLLTGAPRRDALSPVCDTIQWHGAGSYVAIDWTDEAGHQQVNTGLDESLGGAPLPDGTEDGGDPWSRSRAEGEGVVGAAADLDATRAGLAASASAASYWVEPVRWSDVHRPATVTVWTGADRSPLLHSYGMAVAKNIVELILRWTEQVRELDLAARFDPLTGLANRRAFFGALEASGPGAVLYCDLDRFKPVNDTLGHAAGDELLRHVARRLEAAVREGDVVARLGGDEFAVLCGGASLEVAEEVAARIRTALAEPFHLGDHRVTVGVSVGVAADAVDLSEQVLEAADRALGTAKADRRR